MPRRAQRLLLATLLALYGAVSLCGAGLHAVSGCDHASLVLDFGNRSDPCGEDGDPAAPPAPSTISESCPVCQHQIQGQLAAVTSIGFRPDLATSPASVPPPTLFASEPRSLSRPRAPPSPG